MDIDEIFQTLRKFSACFPTVEGKVVSFESGGSLIFQTGIRFQELLVILVVVRGPRGGLREELVVVDPTQLIEADRLKVAWVAGLPLDRSIVSLNRMRKDIRAGAECGQVIRQAIEHAISWAESNPEHFRVMLRDGNAAGEGTLWSVRALATGSPRT